MNRERSKKLLKHTGLAVLKRPDGGVVTQRTANPLFFSRYLPKSATFPKKVSSRAVLLPSGHFREHNWILLTLLVRP
jgi:hypothetical protein